MNSRNWLPIIATIAMASLAPSASEAQDRPLHHRPQLVEFDAPGSATSSSGACGQSCGTQAFANNDEGTIVGSYTDENVVAHGFLRTPGGQFVAFDAPGAGLGAGLDQGTFAMSINDLGVIAGQVQDENNVFHGFVRDWKGSFVIIDGPDAGAAAFQGTALFDINFEGATAGIEIDASNTVHGFLRLNGKNISFDPPGSTYTFVCQETCLNQGDMVTGFYIDTSNVSHGFLRKRDGSITTLDAPGAGGGAGQGTTAASIDPEGAITGYFFDAGGAAHGFVRYSSGRYATFDAPGGSSFTVANTAAFSINLFGAVTGEALDTNSVMHGFVRSPYGSFTTFDAPGAGTGSGQGTRPSTNNLAGAVAGWWVDGNGVNHGFLRDPS